MSCGDSSGFGAFKTNMKRAGLKQEADEIGIELADFDDGRVVVCHEATANNRFVIANRVPDADGLVSLPKLKTHEFTVYTGAIKNQYGCIPGIIKNQQHARFPSQHEFATMLVDLNILIRPRLFIMDTIMAMEGNGPRSGSPRKPGALLFSSDPVALDAMACRIINLDPERVPAFELAAKAGLGTYHNNNIEVIDED